MQSETSQDILPLRPDVPPDVHDLDLEVQILVVDVRDEAAVTLDVSDRRVLFMDNVYSAMDHPEQQAHGRSSNRDGPTVVYIFGVTGAGNSVCVTVSGFCPFFYIECTAAVTFTLLRTLGLELANKMHIDAEKLTIASVRHKRAYGWVPVSDTNPAEVRQFQFARFTFPSVGAMRYAAFLVDCHNKTLRELDASKMSAEEFDEAKANRVKWTRSKPKTLERVKEKLRVSEVKTQPSEKFMAGLGLVASGWMTLPAGSFEDVSTDSRSTICQLEVSCHARAPRPLVVDRIAPIVIAGVDIEATAGDYRSFPVATNPADKCIYIGTTFWVYGERQPRARVMQVLGPCDPVEGIIVESYATEYELLAAWRDLIAVRADPDKVVTYNGTGFDFPYLYGRYRLMHPKGYSRFPHLGRFLAEGRQLEKRELSSAAMGQNEISWFPLSGRWQMDLFQYVKTNQKLSSYTLNDVCNHFLKEHKGTMSKIVLDFPGWVAEQAESAHVTLCGIADTLRAFGDVPGLTKCRDSASNAVLLSAAPLPVSEDGSADDDEDAESARWMHVHAALQTSIDAIASTVETLRCSDAVRADIRRRLDEGVQPALDASGSNNYKKLFRMYDESPAHRARIAEYCQVDCDLVLYLMDRINVIPNTVQMSEVTRTQLDDIANRGQQIKTFNLIARFAYENDYVMNFINVGWDPEAEYEGATVLEPKPAYYQRPVATLDFASLYPSLMQAYNLCFSSLVLDDRFAHMEDHGAQYGRYDIGGRVWTFQEHQKGLLPRILEELLSARRSCKKAMKAFTKGSMDYRLADGRQLALKISCNSVYGFCGVLNNGMFPCMPVAVATTYNGRHVINQTKEFVERQYGADVVYGDSVTPETPIVVRVGGRTIIVREIARLVSKSQWVLRSDGKETAELKDVEFYTKAGWTTGQRLIRHRLAPSKNILQVETGRGVVRVTSDHSLLRADGSCVSPVDVKEGDELMHAAPVGQRLTAPTGMPLQSVALHRMQTVVRYFGEQLASGTGIYTSVPAIVLTHPFTLGRQFLIGMFGGLHVTPIHITGALAAHSVYILLGMLRYVVSVRVVGEDEYVLATTESAPSIAVIAAKLLPTCRPAYVYDVTTENGHFQAGVGSIIVHNTDSVMVQYPNVTTVAECFELSARVAREATAIFRDVVVLEFEKVYFPYLLIRKKHYAGMKYEDDPNAPPELDVKGLALVRRDNCRLVRTTMRDVLNKTMRDGDPEAAFAIVQQEVERLVRREVGMDELEISNSLRKDYKDDHHPHVQVVKNMRARHAFDVPRCGDRVPYVILEGRPHAKIYERAEHPKYVIEKGLKVDLLYYLENQLQKRLEKVLKPLPVPSVDALFNRAKKEIQRKRLGLRSLNEFFLPLSAGATAIDTATATATATVTDATTAIDTATVTDATTAIDTATTVTAPDVAIPAAVGVLEILPASAPAAPLAPVARINKRRGPPTSEVQRKLDGSTCASKKATKPKRARGVAKGVGSEQVSLSHFFGKK